MMPSMEKTPSVEINFTRAPAASASWSLSLIHISQFTEGKITVRFRNEGNEPVRIPDEINDETSDLDVYKRQEEMLKGINDPEAFACALAERAFLVRLGANCSTPVGCLLYTSRCV